MAQFYMTLPNNASMLIYPTNTIANYKTCLPKTIELNGEWEVALVEFTYPKNFHNVLEEECYIDISSNDLMENNITRCYITTGYYSSVQELLDEIHEKIRASCNILVARFWIEKRSAQSSTKGGKVAVKIMRSSYSLKLSKELMYVLGFEMQVLSWIEKYHLGVSAADINRACNTMFIYCDLVQESIVGDSTAPLLRTTNVEVEYGDFIQKTYSNPIYVPLRRNYFSDVEMSIKSESGQDIAFTTGKSIATLHFRRSFNSYIELFAR